LTKFVVALVIDRKRQQWKTTLVRYKPMLSLGNETFMWEFETPSKSPIYPSKERAHSSFNTLALLSYHWMELSCI